jgi:hypothetical protein
MPNKIKIRHGISVKDFEKIVTDMRGGDGIFKSLRQGTLSFAEFLSNLNPFGEQLTPAQVEQLNNERNVIRQEELKKDEIDTPYKIKKAEIAQERVKLRSEERRARLSLAETRAHNRNIAPGFIRQFLDAVFKPLWKKAASYIILAFVLILILKALTGGLKGKSGGGGAHFNPITSLLRAGKNLARTGVNDVKYVGKGIYSESSYIVRKIRAFFNSIIKFFQRLFHPLYKINKLVNMLTGGAHNNALDRAKIESGRCDNMSWVETSTEGAQGTCTKSAHPIDLTWNLNNTQTPEYYDLPSTRKGQLDKYSTVKKIQSKQQRRSDC